MNNLNKNDNSRAFSALLNGRAAKDISKMKKKNTQDDKLLKLRFPQKKVLKQFLTNLEKHE